MKRGHLLNNALPNVCSHKLPCRLTTLVGRDAELLQLRRQLLDPACRLLTLVGPGGIGKTRLALEAVGCLQDEFAGTQSKTKTAPSGVPCRWAR